MKEVVRFQAEDGKLFLTKEGALLWEERIARARDATEAFLTGSTLLEAIEDTAWTGIGKEENREILSRITKDTGLIISYWQCQRTPGYKVIRFNPDGSMWVYGDAGCWSGPYGSDVNLVDLIRYAETTFAEAERRKP